MGPRRCTVEGCKSVSGRQQHRGVTFHTFPLNPVIRNVWLTNCHVPATKTITKSILICSRHFRRADFQPLKNNKYLLKNGAVPTIFPWGSLPYQEPASHPVPSTDELPNDDPNQSAAGSTGGGGNETGNVVVGIGTEVDGNLDDVTTGETVNHEEMIVKRILTNAMKSELKSPMKRSASADVNIASSSSSGGVGRNSRGKSGLFGEPKAKIVRKSLDSAMMSKSINSNSRIVSSGGGNIAQFSDTSSNFLPGSTLEAQDFNELWHPAKVVEVDQEEREVLIHFQVENTLKPIIDEWIPMNSSRLRPIQQVRQPQSIASSSKLTSPILKTPIKSVEKYSVGEKCTAKWTDSRKWKATISKVLENDYYEVLFEDGFSKICHANNMSKANKPKGRPSLQHQQLAQSPELRTDIISSSTPPPAVISAASSSPIPQPAPASTTKTKIKTTTPLPEKSIEVKPSGSGGGGGGGGGRKANPPLPIPKFDLEKLNLLPVPKDGEWCCNWVNDTPIGDEGYLEGPDGFRRPTVLVNDWRLPTGWKKHLYQRSSVSGKWDVVLVGPSKKRFRSKNDVKVYLEERGEQYNPDVYDFSIHKRRAKDIGLFVLTDEYKVELKQKQIKLEAVNAAKQKQLAAAVVAAEEEEAAAAAALETTKATAAATTTTTTTTTTITTVDDNSSTNADDLINSGGNVGNNLISGTIAPLDQTFGSNISIDEPFSGFTPTASTANSSQSLLNISTNVEQQLLSPQSPLTAAVPASSSSSSMTSIRAPLEDGFVYVGSLKVQLIDNLFRCPDEICNKNFRKENHLQIHVKHYHDELAKKMGVCPNMSDLAYLRTMGTPMGDDSIPKNQIPNSQFFEKVYQADLQQSKAHRKSLSSPTNSLPSPQQQQTAVVAAATVSMPTKSDGLIQISQTVNKIGEKDLPEKDINSGKIDDLMPQELLSGGDVSQTELLLQDITPATPSVLSSTPLNKEILVNDTINLPQPLSKNISATTKATTNLKGAGRKKGTKYKTKQQKFKIKIKKSVTKTIKKTTTTKSKSSKNLNRSGRIKTPDLLFGGSLVSTYSGGAASGVGIGETSNYNDDLTNHSLINTTDTASLPKSYRLKYLQKHGGAGGSLDSSKSSSFLDSTNLKSTINSPSSILTLDNNYNSQIVDHSPKYISENGEMIKIVQMRQEEIINCLCSYFEEDGLMIQCELCLCWQHGTCNNIEKESDVPDKYICYICRNPQRGRESMRHIHDQDWLYEGRLPVAQYHSANPKHSERFDMLKQSHTLTGNLLELKKFLHSLRVKMNIAENKDHPKLYLWAKKWERNNSPSSIGTDCGGGGGGGGAGGGGAGAVGGQINESMITGGEQHQHHSHNQQILPGIVPLSSVSTLAEDRQDQKLIENDLNLILHNDQKKIDEIKSFITSPLCATETTIDNNKTPSPQLIKPELKIENHLTTTTTTATNATTTPSTNKLSPTEIDRTLLAGLLSSPGGTNIDLVSSFDVDEIKQEQKTPTKSIMPQQSEMNLLKMNHQQQQIVVNAPEPEAAIDSIQCQVKLLEHIQKQQALAMTRLQTIETHIIGLEAMDEKHEPLETNDNFTVSKQTIFMLLNDLTKMRKLAELNTT